MKMTIGVAMATALMLALPAATFAQLNPPAPATDATDASSGAVDTAAQEANDATATAIDAADNASDTAGDAVESSTDQAIDTADDAADRAQNEADDRADEAQQAGDDVANRADDELDTDLTAEADRDNEANRDNEAPQLDAEAQLDDEAQLRADAAVGSQSNTRFTDEDRNASWRFVERNGVWWYRTPMNTWMIHQGGQWQAQPYSVGYRGAQRGQYYNNQPGQPVYQGQQQAYYNDGYQGQRGQQQAYYNEGRQGQNVRQTSHHEGANHGWGEEHPSVGQQEWMCIDGRRTLVTVVSVTPVTAGEGGQYYPERAAQNEGNQQPMPAAPQDEWQNDRNRDQDQQDRDRNESDSDRMTPPPVPQPNDSASNESADRPEAPSAESLQSATTSSNQSYSAAKPVTDTQQQVPATPQPAYRSGQATQAGPADGSYETAADRNAGRIEATDIRD